VNAPRQLWIIATIIGSLHGRALATPPEPVGQHPRMLLDNTLRAQWRAMATQSSSPVAAAVKICEDARKTRKYDRALYMGSEWSKVLQACLVAWAATNSKDDAATAVRFFTALLDDLDLVGDGRGGDAAAWRSRGYAIRNLGPYTALAYDWLYHHPLMTPELKAHARQRWKVWLAWYRDNGYRASSPGSNYHAGYLFAATTIAIAQAGDAEAAGTALWRHVADQMWSNEMSAALSKRGVLAGGNWPEGWQYGPLSIAEYSLAARLMRGVGVELPGVAPWLSSVLLHHFYALSPTDGVYASGDTEDGTAMLRPHALTLNAVALGDATTEDKRWARGELSRLELTDRDWPLYEALAAVADKPKIAPRSAWPTWYVAANTGTLYARTRWDASAVWFVSECQSTIDTDHRHPNAGNFSLSRGRDDVIVDPSPYGSQSTLTSNAPTVASAQLPPDYIPSQGSWSERTGYAFVTQRASGVVAARCDYADQYTFQHRPSDIPFALRDFVLLPSQDGRDAALLVIDRAQTGASDRGMFLRFRSPRTLALSGDVGAATLGGTRIAIASVMRSDPGVTELASPTARDCSAERTPKGRCDAARFPVSEYRVQIPGPSPVAVHVISATAEHTPSATATAVSGDGWAGVHTSGVRDATVVWRTRGTGALAYSAPPGTHVVLDAPGSTVDVTAQRNGTSCSVRVTNGRALLARPLVLTLDAACAVVLDAEMPAAPANQANAPRATVRPPRAGCCSAEPAPVSTLALALVVLAILCGRATSSRRRASR
jgi:hypothetical protein